MPPVLKRMNWCRFGKSTPERVIEEEEETDYFPNPVLLPSDKANFESDQIFSQLSGIQEPFIVGRDHAVVNLTSLPSIARNGPVEGDGGALGFFERRASTTERGAQSNGLHWTDSRKLLEAAIAVEQASESLHSAPSASLNYSRNDAAMHEKRLISRLKSLSLEMDSQAGDGNCQFRALSVGLYGKPDYHKNIRREAISYIKRNSKDFQVFLGEDFKEWTKNMSRDGVWGDELTLRAACEAYGVVVNVITSDESNWFLRYIPENTLIKHELFLSYIAPVHYDAIKRRPRGMAPMLRSLSSLGRRNSSVLATINKYERAKDIPRNPIDVLME
jgi:hypothetical protein